MSCANYNYKSCNAVTIGYDFTSKITYKEGLFDFTDYTISMTIEDEEGNSILSLAEVGDATSTGIYIPEPEKGYFYIQIRRVDSVSIATSNYLYYINILSSGDDLTPLLSGIMSFNKVV